MLFGESDVKGSIAARVPRLMLNDAQEDSIPFRMPVTKVV